MSENNPEVAEARANGRKPRIHLRRISRAVMWPIPHRLIVEKILDTVKRNGTKYFIVKFQGLDEPKEVRATTCNIQIPQKVIKYYEGRIFGPDTSEDDDDQDEGYYN